jgi:hypothetical protein
MALQPRRDRKIGDSKINDPEQPEVDRETPVSVTVITLAYRAPHRAECLEPGSYILRRANAVGRPIDNAEFCLRHGRERIKSDRAAGIRVYDNRERDSTEGPRY